MTQQPTIQQTLAAIRALPNMSARYKSEYKEFQVFRTDYPDNRADYFTDDRGDALMTAVQMSKY